MLTNILTLAALLLAGFPLRAVGKRFGIPPAATLMVLGVLASSSVFDLIPDSYMVISTKLSVAAFVILLLRAGLGMAPLAMKSMVLGIVAIGLIPAIGEMAVLAIGSRLFLFERWDLALLAAFLIAAISPAVILPTMLDQKAKGRGGPRLVPDRIMGLAIVNSFMAKAAITTLLVVVVGGNAADEVGRELIFLPLTLAAGIMLGALMAFLMTRVFPKNENRTTPIWIGAGFVLFAALVMYFRSKTLYIEGVFAVLAFGVGIRIFRGPLANGFRGCFDGLWAVAEIPLFVNVGALIDLGRLHDPRLIIGLLALMAFALAFRKWVAWNVLKKSDLSRPERIYMTLAQVPKATIQAVFGSVVFITLTTRGPELADAGQTMLIMAVLAIIATAPIGAVVLDRWGGRLLEQDKPGAS